MAVTDILDERTVDDCCLQGKMALLVADKEN